MNILSYDYHSAFEPAVNHHAPLYALEEASEYNYDAELNIVSKTEHIRIILLPVYVDYYSYYNSSLLPLTLTFFFLLTIHFPSFSKQYQLLFISRRNVTCHTKMYIPLSCSEYAIAQNTFKH